MSAALNHPWVIIPTYNERGNIEQLITALYDLAIPNLSILIVDDSSPDGTSDIVKKLQQQHPSLHLKSRPGKSGLGRAYVDGFSHALQNGATALVQMDADFSHDPTEIPKLLKALEEHDLALGSRYSNGISVINWPLKRLLISMGGNLYASLITGLPFKDTTGGFRAWRAQTLQDINLDTLEADGYGFQIATVYRTWKQGKKITEVPIIFTERREGQSKMSSSIVREAIFLVWRIRFFDKTNKKSLHSKHSDSVSHDLDDG